MYNCTNLDLPLLGWQWYRLDSAEQRMYRDRNLLYLHLPL